MKGMYVDVVKGDFRVRVSETDEMGRILQVQYLTLDECRRYRQVVERLSETEGGRWNLYSAMLSAAEDCVEQNMMEHDHE